MVWDAWMHQMLWLHALMEQRRRSPRESIMVEEVRKPTRRRDGAQRNGRQGAASNR